MTTNIDKYVKYSYSVTGVDYEDKEVKQTIVLSANSPLTEVPDPATSALGCFYSDTTSNTGFKGAIFKDSETETTLNVVIGFAALAIENLCIEISNFMYS